MAEALSDVIRAENGELRALVIEIESALSDLPRIETESETADSDRRGKPDDGLFSLRENVGDFIFESRSAEFSHTTRSVADRQNKQRFLHHRY